MSSTPPDNKRTLKFETYRDSTIVTREQAPGAMPNGTRIEKTVRNPGDAHGPGDQATVIGSLGPVTMNDQKLYGYFVEWDDMPGAYVLVASHRVREVKTQ